MTLNEYQAFSLLDIPPDRRAEGGGEVGMMDREKVIKGLMCIAGDVVFCAHCKYSDVNGSGRGDRCKRDCAKDALALLKAQEPIDAIPMDWMDAQIRGYASALKSTELKALVLVKQMWEKAQEAR